MEGANSLNVYASPLPFSNKQILIPARLGDSLQDVVDGLEKSSACIAIVSINGEIIPPLYWPAVRPKLGTVVNVRIIPHGGGGGGGKNPIVTVLSLAVLFAAPYVGGFIGVSALNAGLGLTAAQGIFIGRVAAVGFGLLGALAVSALAPPPKQSNAGQVNNASESPTQFIEGASNTINPYGVVPICLGTNRMFPLQAAKPFTESQDDNQYVRQLFTYGWGEQLIINEIKIGETDISEFTDIDLEHRLEGNLHTGTTLFTNDVNQADYNVLLEEVDGYLIRTTAIDVDEAIVDITFPRGLVQFNDSGDKNPLSVIVEIQYALNSDSPQVWSVGNSYHPISGDSFTVPIVTTTTTRINISGTNYFVGYRKDVAVIDKVTGEISVITGESITGSLSTVTAPVLPQNKIGLSTVLVRTLEVIETGIKTTAIQSFTDDRQESYFGDIFQNDTDFAVTAAGTTITVDAGDLLNVGIKVTGAQSEAIRRSLRLVFPTNGTYDIRLKRVTPDSTSDRTFDLAYLTAIKSIKHQSPVALQGINGTAVRIRGTDQLNGALEQFNCIVSNAILDYNSETDTWVRRVTSNPASIYRYVLQGAANAKALADYKLDLTAIQEWHTYCELQGYTYNRVIDYEASVNDVLNDVCASGAASPAIVDGLRTIVIDKVKSDVVQIITPRNSWGYTGQLAYPDLPHALRVQFRNKEKGYQLDERIVYDDGYTELNATKFEVLEMLSCTNSDLAFKNGRRHIAAARLRPETHSFMLDVENLVALRGDRIKLAHDIPIVGIGDGRIKTLTYDVGSPTMVTGFTLDDSITFPTSGTYYVRARKSDGTIIYEQLITAIGEATSFVFATPLLLADAPEVGNLCYFLEAGGELDLIITRIEPSDDFNARITAIDYAPEVFTAENSIIPAFTSRITTPLEFIRPAAPILLTAQSDEDVMIRNPDGTYSSRAIFTLDNPNEGNIQTIIKLRRSGTTAFGNAQIVEATPERVIVTGLDDGERYDINIYYKRINANLLSLPLQINNYLFEGVTGLPDDVQNFLVTITESAAFFKWDANDDIDLSHYIIKFSRVFSGASWGTAQTLEDNIYETRINLPFIGGTYLIKAVDLSGNESANAAEIITFDEGQLINAVETLIEAPSFNGVKDNCTVVSGALVLSDTAYVGYYYFENIIDLTDVFTAFVSASIVAGGAYVNDLFDISDLFGESDLFGSGGNDLFLSDDLFAEADLFGIGTDSWRVTLQYAITPDDPTASPAPVSWEAYSDFSAGSYSFWGIRFRLKLESLSAGISPSVTTLTVNADMPDRIERGDDLIVPIAGTTITHSPAFKNNPAIAITLQNAASDDRIEYTSKTSSGFTFKVYNTGSAAYVQRTYDYIASGYGRVNV
jgi:hypothetical protein